MVHKDYILPSGYKLHLQTSYEGLKLQPESIFFRDFYFRALENSALKGFEYIYGTVLKDKHPVALVYFQLVDLSHVSIGSVIQSEPYGKFMQLIGDKVKSAILGKKRSKPNYLLVNGNMCISGNYGIYLKDITAGEFSSLYKDIYEAVVSRVEEKGDVSATIVKDFGFDDDYLSDTLKGKGFIRFVMDPVMRMDVRKEWKTFDDYLKDLSSKYRLRTINVLEKMAGFDLRELSKEDLLKHNDDLEELYQNVVSKSPVRIAQPDMNYIRSLKEHVPCFRVMGWFKEGRPVAFFTAFSNSNITEAHHIGMDYHLNRSHNLYQNILYELIRIAIDSKSDALDYGRTAMEMKSTVGALPFNFAAYIKMNNRMINHLVKPFLPSEPPSNWVQRDPFRKS